jgi:hypothetical protein
MSNIIETAEKVTKYILEYRRPLLVILTKKKARFYFDEEEFREKYEDCWEAEHQIFVTLVNHGLEVESRGNDDLIVMFARIPGEELTPDEQEERLEWVKRKLTDNGVEWPEDLIRVFIGLPMKAKLPLFLQPRVPPPGEGTQVIPRGEGTIMIRGPGGETRVVTAMLQTPSKTIPVSTLPQRFGREDFVGIVSSDLLATISRREGPGAKAQFTIGYDYAQGTFVIWDDGSTNGTYLNGEDIRGRGRRPLKNGDIISPANAFNIKFISGPA